MSTYEAKQNQSGIYLKKAGSQEVIKPNTGDIYANLIYDFRRKHSCPFDFFYMIST